MFRFQFKRAFSEIVDRFQWGIGVGGMIIGQDVETGRVVCAVTAVALVRTGEYHRYNFILGGDALGLWWRTAIAIAHANDGGGNYRLRRWLLATIDASKRRRAEMGVIAAGVESARALIVDIKAPEKRGGEHHGQEGEEVPAEEGQELLAERRRNACRCSI